MSLATKLVALRKQKKMTQLELAERLNVSRQAISRWEVGAAVPSTDNLKILGELYGVSVDYLLHDEHEDSADSHSSKPDVSLSEQIDVGKRNRYINVITFLLAIAAVIVILFYFVQAGQNNEEQAIPLEDMATQQEDIYPLETFQFEE